ncbi:hypothetical protein BpHYR1_012705 [Brachionus plicatilis]|uniref:Uncharacterized protein n=1 Tax=Brachionus plicatilis TaxID=10195 RepID=A0A3M7PCI2_BRAPC|nr:hypothetical protein BpHYR1_012705 [Brachionus plicatilis]
MGKSPSFTKFDDLNIPSIIHMIKFSRHYSKDMWTDLTFRKNRNLLLETCSGASITVFNLSLAPLRFFENFDELILKSKF